MKLFNMLGRLVLNIIFMVAACGTLGNLLLAFFNLRDSGFASFFLGITTAAVYCEVVGNPWRILMDYLYKQQEIKVRKKIDESFEKMRKKIADHKLRYKGDE